MSFYERLVPRRMNFILFWFLVSMVIWGIFELAMFLLGENEYPLMRFLFCFLGFGFIPVQMTILKRSFEAATRGLDQIIHFPVDDYPTWIKTETWRIFNFSTASVWLRVGLTTAAIIILSVWGMRFIYHSPTAIIILYVIASIIFSLGIHGQYVIEKLLGFLTRIETYPVTIPFSHIDHPLLLGLFRFYYQAAVLTLFSLLLMVALLWTTPWILSPEVILAISLVTFYPPALFVWSAFKIHRMMAKAKNKHLEIIIARIQASLEQIETDPSKDNLNSLQILLEVKKTIKNELDWPVNPESVTTLLFTFLIPAVNFLITVWGRLSKP